MPDTHTLKELEGTPSSTIGTRMFIAEGASSGSLSFVELTSITEIGDLGGDAEDIDVTTLRQTERSYVPGVKDFPSVDVTLLLEDKNVDSSTTPPTLIDNYSILRDAEAKGTVHCVDVLFPNNRGIRFFAKIKTRQNGATVNGALTFVASFYKTGDSQDVDWSETGGVITVTPVE